MNWPEFEEPEFWYPPIDHHNNHPTAAYSWLNYQGHQGRLPTGMHPSQSERYAPFGTIDFNERDRDGSAGRYQPVPYGYAVDFFDDARDLEDTKEAHIWARLEATLHTIYESRPGKAAHPMASFTRTRTRISEATAIPTITKSYQMIVTCRRIQAFLTIGTTASRPDAGRHAGISG